MNVLSKRVWSLNAPYGAPRFLTNLRDYNKGESDTS